MVDACHSGYIQDDSSESFEAIDMAENTNATGRGVLFSQTQKADDVIRMSDLFWLDNNSGIAVIAAANGDQKALEGSRDGGSELQNGFFSSSFIEAIQRNLSIRELKPYIEYQVLQLSGGEQKPFARQELFKIDWELIRACNDARNMD
jgi:hypothetical protein